MFTVPEALTFGTMIIGGSGIAITGLCKWRPRGTNGYMPKSLCDERSQGIKDDIAEIKSIQRDILKELRK